MHILRKCVQPLSQCRLFTNTGMIHVQLQRTQTDPSYPQKTDRLVSRGPSKNATAKLDPRLLDIVDKYQIKKVPSRDIENKPDSTSYTDKVDFPPALMAAVGNCLEVGGFQLYPWSLSGLETCVVVKKDNLQVAFDMGYSFREAVKCPQVFISHGHIDHVASLMSHASKRGLSGQKPATYYVPGHLVSPLSRAHAAFAEAHGDVKKFATLNLVPADSDSVIPLGSQWHARPFPTVHRVPSQGYILYRTDRKLKPEFQGLPGAEIGRLIREGADVHDVITSPQVAYTGDTSFDVFLNPPNDDLLKVKLLITEATYVDNDVDRNGKPSSEKARERGHCHLKEFVQHEHLFKDVENILFIHFSDKYSSGFVQKMVHETVPESFRSKVHLGVQLKERYC